MHPPQPSILKKSLGVEYSIQQASLFPSTALLITFKAQSWSRALPSGLVPRSMRLVKQDTKSRTKYNNLENRLVPTENACMIKPCLKEAEELQHSVF